MTTWDPAVLCCFFCTSVSDDVLQAVRNLEARTSGRNSPAFPHSGPSTADLLSLPRASSSIARLVQPRTENRANRELCGEVSAQVCGGQSGPGWATNLNLFFHQVTDVISSLRTSFVQREAQLRPEASNTTALMNIRQIAVAKSLHDHELSGLDLQFASTPTRSKSGTAVHISSNDDRKPRCQRWWVIRTLPKCDRTRKYSGADKKLLSVPEHSSRGQHWKRNRWV